MTRVLSAEEREIVRTNYSHWHIYRVLEGPALAIALECHPFSLSPEEVFYEALRMVDEFRLQDIDEMAFARNLWMKLSLRYRDYEGKESDNSKLCASTVAYAVGTLILASQRGKITKVLNAIFTSIAMAGHIDHVGELFKKSIHTHYRDLADAREWIAYYDSDESISEKLSQQFLTISGPAIQFVPKYANAEEKRVSIIRGVWETIQVTPGFVMNQTALFYVYRIMAENGWYPIDSYTQFRMDADNAGVEKKYIPAESVFSRKNKDFDPEDRYLNVVGNLQSTKPNLEHSYKLIAEATQKIVNYYKE